MDKILDGSQEQDAYECFGILKSILIRGTRTCLLDNVSDASADMFTSLPQFWFEHGKKTTYICKKCNHSRDSYENISEHSLVPTKNSTILEMLSNSLKDEVDQINCSNCGNKTHASIVSFTDHPRILCFLILRYTYENGATNMNFAPINVLTEFTFCNVKYNLLSIIHHHRNNNFRHYTSTVHYENYFHIDDSVVNNQRMDDLGKSHSAYIIMYKQTPT